MAIAGVLFAASFASCGSGGASLAPRPGKLVGLSVERVELLCMGEATQARILSLSGSPIHFIFARFHRPRAACYRELRYVAHRKLRATAETSTATSVVSSPYM